jgi:ABC-type dipeptide/oligopeptide/nickel transport system permease subunit
LRRRRTWRRFLGLAIVFVVVGFNLVGDALRDALDPRL